MSDFLNQEQIERQKADAATKQAEAFTLLAKVAAAWLANKTGLKVS